jgi:TrmH family RNA methyltransferase
MITSSHNPKIKLARSLSARSKDRREAGAFLAEGVRLIEEAVQSGWPVRYILYTDEVSARGHELIERSREIGLNVEQATSKLIQSLTDTEYSQGIIAVLEEYNLPLPPRLDFVLIPDQIRDPGNLGSLLRSAIAAGVNAVLLPDATVDIFAPKVVRSGMGAHFRLPIKTISWDEIAITCNSAALLVYLAEMSGAPCWESDLSLPLALIIGGEAQGASERARKFAAKKIAIPMKGGSESLNAAAAGSVLMFEVIRQREFGRVHPE